MLGKEDVDLIKKRTISGVPLGARSSDENGQTGRDGFPGEKEGTS